ncbi:MAG: FAD-dependent oxidoreductase [Bdellovibrio sp.]|nr:FAD-dependent oxidoreductase [Bdellovibrio sp.]
MKKTDRNLAPSFSYKSSKSNYTGSWRFIKPLYQNKTPPCNLGCPNTNDIQGFIEAINADNLKEAFTILTRTTPFPAICGRVCYHPCESHCNRSQYDEAVNICALERVVGDYALEQKLALSPGPQIQSPQKKIAIVGSGPAGLNCAYHLRRLNHKVTIFESRSKAGGMLRHGIPEFRLPKHILDGEIQRLLNLGIEIKYNFPIGKKELENLAQTHQAVFLAIGAYRPKEVAIEGSNLTGVSSGLNFLLTHAYESETSRFNVKDKKVAVVGGGNTAIDTARTALRLGAIPTIYYRRTRHEMPAHPDEIREALEEGIAVEFLVNPIECRGKNGNLRSIFFQRMQLGETDASGRKKSIPIPGQNFEVAADFLFTAFGEDAEMGDLAIPLENKWGRFVKKEHLRSTMQNVFLGGDAVSDTQGTVVHAMGEGLKAARIIDQFLAETPLTVSAQIGPKVGHEDLNMAYFHKSLRNRSPERSQAERKSDFLPVIGALAKNTYTHEAKRCFSCGVCNYCRNCELFCPDKSIRFKMDGFKSLSIDYDHCKGCGICVYECPRCAMEMAKE